MKKTKLVTAPDVAPLVFSAERPRKVSSVRAIGYGIVVEMLTKQEASGSELYNLQQDSNQAYILSIGPLVDEKSGIRVGQRVVLQGSFVPLPNPDGSRKMGSVNLHDIKAVLDENA